MSELQKAAEILVECGYCEDVVTMPATIDPESDNASFCYWDLTGKGNSLSTADYHLCDSFADTLEGRRQADTIEDWLWYHQNRLWANSFHAIDEPIDEKASHHQWRLDRIKWCLQQLEGDV